MSTPRAPLSAVDLNELRQEVADPEVYRYPTVVWARRCARLLASAPVVLGLLPMSVRFVNPLGVAEESEAGYLETTGAQRSKEHRA